MSVSVYGAIQVADQNYCFPLRLEISFLGSGGDSSGILYPGSVFPGDRGSC